MRRKTLNKKINDGEPKQVREKFISPEVEEGVKLSTLNNKQKLLFRYLKEGRQVVFARGSAGCGKSYVTASHAAHLLKAKKIDKIALVRANVSVGRSLGMLPGTLEEKLLPFFQQTLAHLETFLGKGFTSYCLEHKTIEMLSLEHMRGMSISNAFILVEESQNLTKEEIEMIVTRIGENTQIAFTGDDKQKDLRTNGLSDTINMFETALEQQPDYLDDEDLDELEVNIGIVDFSPEDVVRSGICKSLVKLYYYQGK